MDKLDYFDHIIGQEEKDLSNDEIKIYQSIIIALYKKQSIEEKRLIEKIGLMLELEEKSAIK